MRRRIASRKIPHKSSATDQGRSGRGRPLIVEGKRAQTARHTRVGVEVDQLAAVLEMAKPIRSQE